MARRSLGKLDVATDVSQHLMFPEQLQSPWDASVLFGREAPVELEIGSGKGLFLCRAAADNPDHDFLGIEIGKKYARFCAIALARLDISNARILSGDAIAFLDRFVSDDSLDAIHVYFPDPWWKRAHRKRRVLREDTLRLIERRLKPGGHLHFRTDVKEYFDATRKLLLRSTAFETVAEDIIVRKTSDESFAEPLSVGSHIAPPPKPRPHSTTETLSVGVPQLPVVENEGDFRTHFERRTLIHGEPVYRALFRKPLD